MTACRARALLDGLRDISSVESGVKTEIRSVGKSSLPASSPQGLAVLRGGRKCLRGCAEVLTACQVTVRKHEDGARCDSRWRDPRAAARAAQTPE